MTRIFRSRLVKVMHSFAPDFHLLFDSLFKAIFTGNRAAVRVLNFFISIIKDLIGNLNVGNDKRFLISIASQCVPYIGFPRVLNALSCINAGFSERESNQ